MMASETEARIEETTEETKSTNGCAATTVEVDNKTTSEPLENNADSTDETNPLEKKIIRQLEFYFGSRNLARDKFLQEKIKEDPDGWVTLEVLLTFNRLKSLSSDSKFICQAIKKSKSGLLEVSDDQSKIRLANRVEQLPSVGLLSPEQAKDMKARTVYLKGFPEDTSLDDIQEFALQFGETELIQMRRLQNEPKTFKGSVFVEFKDVSSVNKVTEVNGLKFKDNELLVETKEQYWKRQNEKRKLQKQATGEDDHEEPKSKRERKDDEDGNENEQENKLIRNKHAVLHFKGCGSNTKREDIKELFNQWCEVAWVDFSMGDTEGYIRFGEDNGATKALEALTKDGPKICGEETTARVLEGDEEFAFWKKMSDDKKKKGGNRGGNRKGFKKHKRGGNR